MSKTITGKFSSLTLNTEDIFKEIDKNELERRREAAKFAAKTMRKNIRGKGISSPGGYPTKRTGTLAKSISYQLDKQDRSAKVGTKDFKAHLLEFGHGDGKTRNKRPFVMKSLREAEDEIIKIMSKEYF